MHRTCPFFLQEPPDLPKITLTKFVSEREVCPIVDQSLVEEYSPRESVCSQCARILPRCKRCGVTSFSLRKVDRHQVFNLSTMEIETIFSHECTDLQSCTARVAENDASIKLEQLKIIYVYGVRKTKRRYLRPYKKGELPLGRS